ncbi:MAG: FAD-dependent monooxygenase [Nocardiopsaceae bacterium]|nr:FAD-dependent monooxygenase [Nocardiopsaceae bacterium]
MSQDPRALIVGGSLAGLSAAAWLASAGFAVDVLERAPGPLQDFGAGIVLHPATIRFLTEHEGLRPEELGLGVSHLRYIGPGGEVTSQAPSRLRFSSYGMLYRRLRETAERQGARYHAGATVVSVGTGGPGGDGPGSPGAWVVLDSGERIRGDIVVGADGVHSTVRRQLFPGARPAWAGYVAWRGVIDESGLEPAVAVPLADAITYYIGRRSHLLTYPIADADGRRVLRNWVWYRNLPSRGQLRALLRDRHGVLHDLSVPAGVVADAAAAGLREAAAGLPPPLAALVARTCSPFLQVVVDVEPTGLVAGRACVLGDAGFVARPHAAAGTAKAAEEARLLAAALRASPAGTASPPEGTAARTGNTLALHSGNVGYEGEGGVAGALARWEPEALALGRDLVARSRVAGERAQVTGAWETGEPLPFGLRAIGDSEDWP